MLACLHLAPLASFFLSAGVTVSRANSCQSDSSGFLEEPLEAPAGQVDGHHRRVRIGWEEIQVPSALPQSERAVDA